MFTGIITEIGRVERMQSLNGGIQFRIGAPQSAKELRVNDSVSINGACHTVIGKNETSFEVESVEETLKKTALGLLGTGASVNLELPMKASGRFDGHMVLGHVDTVGFVASISRLESSAMVTVEIPEEFIKYVVAAGSVAIDGVSLTVAQLDGNRCTVAIIPHTMEHTIVRLYKIGTKVNIELDIVGKYIERMLASGSRQPTGKTFPNENQLRDLGY